MMWRKWFRLAAGAFGLVVVSCGSTQATSGRSSVGDSSSTMSATPVATDASSVPDAPTTTEAATSEYKTMAELLDAFASRGVVCDPYVKGDHPKLGTREWGDCTWGGSTFFVALGSGNTEQTRQHLDAFRGLGSGYVLLSGNYYINTDDSAEAGVLAEKLGMPIF